MAKSQYEYDIMSKLMDEYKKVFVDIMSNQGMFDKNGNFNDKDFVRIMSHMKKAHETFIIATEVWYEYNDKCIK